MPQKASHPVPEGKNTITSHLWFDGECRKAIDFYQRALGAEIVSPPLPTPDGEGVLLATIRIGNSHLMLSDISPDGIEKAPKNHVTASLWLYVSNCDQLFYRAIQSGCTVLSPLKDAYWGDRLGKIRDPFGHCWVIASRKWDLTPEEIHEKHRKWVHSIFKKNASTDPQK